MIRLRYYGAWLSLVERSVRDREVVGSNPIAPTNFKKKARADPGLAFFDERQEAPVPLSAVVTSLLLLGLRAGKHVLDTSQPSGKLRVLPLKLRQRSILFGHFAI